MTLTAEFTNAVQVNRAIELQISTGHDLALESMAGGVIQKVQSVGSRWPVRTGDSKLGFDYSIRGDVAHMVNDFDYAVYVERRNRVVENIIRGEGADLVRLADERLDDHLEDFLSG